MRTGIVLSGPDKALEAKAKSLKLPVTIDAAWPLAFEKTLFVAPGTRVPWDLLPAAWHFLERWDCAVPLWRYGVLAADVGTKEERRRTAEIVRDLRVLVHSVELLFVRAPEGTRGDDGHALIEVYRRELADSSEPRLAFLRAFYQVKPRLCVLPTSWLADVDERSKQDARSRVSRPRRSGPLVAVEVVPGTFVKCHAGDEEQVRAQYAERLRRRHE